MVEQIEKKHQREATKALLIDILKSATGLTILMSRPSGSMYYPKYFFKDGQFDRTKFRRTIRHAQNYGYIDVRERKDELTLTLRELGQSKALRYSLEDIHIVPQALWDNKWRMVFFDIPEDMRPVRNMLKAKLDEMGFAQIQKSVYVHAFPCHNEIGYIRSMFGLESFIRLAILDKLENDEPLRKRFGV